MPRRRSEEISYVATVDADEDSGSGVDNFELPPFLVNRNL